MQTLSQSVWCGAWDSACLTSTQVSLLPSVWDHTWSHKSLALGAAGRGWQEGPDHLPPGHKLLCPFMNISCLSIDRKKVRKHCSKRTPYSIFFDILSKAIKTIALARGLAYCVRVYIPILKACSFEDSILSWTLVSFVHAGRLLHDNEFTLLLLRHYHPTPAK